MKALLPQLQASISPAIDVGLAADRSTTIRTSLRDVERTLVIAVLLVIVVVFAFLRSLRATFHSGGRRLGVAGCDVSRPCIWSATASTICR